MDFWTSARATLHGATECLRLDHTYPAEVELHIERCQSILQAIRSLQVLDMSEEDIEILNRWATNLEERLQQLQTVADNITRDNHNNSFFELKVNVKDTKTGGRPRKEIELEAVLSLMRAGFRKQEISDISGVSRSTLLRRM